MSSGEHACGMEMELGAWAGQGRAEGWARKTSYRRRVGPRLLLRITRGRRGGVPRENSVWLEQGFSTSCC